MRNVMLWIVAVLLAAATLTYQRVTGPTYPVRVRAELCGAEVRGKLLRSHETGENLPVALTVTDQSAQGVVHWRRFPTDEPWATIPMVREGEEVRAAIPTQPMAGKVEYRVELTAPSGAAPSRLLLPESGPAVARYKRAVPGWALIPHVVFISLAMVWSMRAGLEALGRRAKQRQQAMMACGLMVLAGLIFGPIVQKFAFDAFWTGWPFGQDLTDNKTAVAMLFWLIALYMGRGGRQARAWVIAASAVTLLVFLIPHSMLGSQLDYSAISKG
ncbi:MAG: hypothetical protein AB1486_27400 [Planctomycetota bacterium]